jgi:hypothetical protein
MTTSCLAARRRSMRKRVQVPGVVETGYQTLKRQTTQGKKGRTEKKRTSHTAQSKGKVTQMNHTRSASGQVKSECWGPVGPWLWKEAKYKEEKLKSDLCGGHSNCYWFEVSKREKTMERSTEKQFIGREDQG